MCLGVIASFHSPVRRCARRRRGWDTEAGRRGWGRNVGAEGAVGWRVKNGAGRSCLLNHITVKGITLTPSSLFAPRLRHTSPNRRTLPSDSIHDPPPPASPHYHCPPPTPQPPTPTHTRLRKHVSEGSADYSKSWLTRIRHVPNAYSSLVPLTAWR